MQPFWLFLEAFDEVRLLWLVYIVSKYLTNPQMAREHLQDYMGRSPGISLLLLLDGCNLPLCSKGCR